MNIRQGLQSMITNNKHSIKEVHKNAINRRVNIKNGIIREGLDI